MLLLWMNVHPTYVHVQFRIKLYHFWGVRVFVIELTHISSFFSKMFLWVNVHPGFIHLDNSEYIKLYQVASLGECSPSIQTIKSIFASLCFSWWMCTPHLYHVSFQGECSPRIKDNSKNICTMLLLWTIVHLQFRQIWIYIFIKIAIYVNIFVSI